jgi:hypothetical protein
MKMLREYVHSNESVAEEDQHTLHFGCDGSVCADSSEVTNWQISLSDLAFAMEVDAGELSMAEPPTSTTHATMYPVQLITVPTQSAGAFEPQATTRSAKQPACIDKEAWQFLGHSLRDDTVTNAITQAPIAAIAAIMRNTTLSASEKQRRAQALRSGQMLDEDFMYSKVAALSAAHVTWLLNKPPLPSDSHGLTMWPRDTNSERILLPPPPY